MSAPFRPIPDEQTQAFNLAICQRLGIDPALISEQGFRADFQVVSGEELGKVNVSFTAYLPAQEVLDLFNGAARPGPAA